MFKTKVLSRILIPAAAVVSESTKKTATNENVCKPSELPLYTHEKPTFSRAPETSSEASVIENAFGTVRRSLFQFTSEVQAYKRVATEYAETGLENAEGVIKYLGEEDRVAPKAGAIALGGLTGIILGLRGGFFKRTLYGTIGSGIMASICYPKEAKEYSEVAYTEGRKYATIAYNFIYGVKKGDPPLELPTIKIPGTVSEAWQQITNFGKSNSVTDKEQQKDEVKKS